MAGEDGESEGARERVAPSSSTLWRRVSPRALRFARDSPLEGDGFELPVPRELISAGGRNPAASGSTSALDGATRAQLGGAERTVARKWHKTGIFPPFRDRRA